MQFSDKISEQMAGESKARVSQWYDFVTERLGREPRVYAMSLRSMKRDSQRLSVLARLWMESRFQPYFG